MKSNTQYLIDLLHDLRSSMNEISYDFCGDSHSGNIDDVFSEYADSDVSVYTSEQFEWAKSHLGDIEDANAELGRPNDICGEFSQAWYLCNVRELNEDLDKIKKYLALAYIEDHFASDVLDLLDQSFFEDIEINANLDEVNDFGSIDDNVHDAVYESLHEVITESIDSYHIDLSSIEEIVTENNSLEKIATEIKADDIDKLKECLALYVISENFDNLTDDMQDNNVFYSPEELNQIKKAAAVVKNTDSYYSLEDAVVEKAEEISNSLIESAKIKIH